MMTIRLALLTTVLAFVATAAFLPDAQAAKENFDRSKPHLAVSASSNDLDLCGFSQMSGLGVEIETIEVSDPMASDRKRPGRTTYSTITLKRPYNGATDVQEWAAGGGLPLRNITIDLITPSAEPVVRFELIDCFPVRWQLDATSRGGTVETLTISPDRIEFKKA